MSSTRKIIIAAVVVVVLAAGAGVWWFLRDDAPEEANVDTAASAVEEAAASTGSSTPDASDAEPGSDAEGVTGTWTVDTETGDFSYEEATGTFAGFRIAEELRGVGETTAVGRTGDVSGEVTIEGTTLTEATFEVDLTTITTETSMRDSQVQRALNTGDNPTTTFTLTSPVDLGDEAASGESIEVTATGDLTVNGVTNEVELAIEARLVESTIVLVGTTEIAFSDYDVSVPSSPSVLSVADVATVEAQILLVR